MKKKIIIDTDPAMGTKGGDPEDCFAIMLAMNSPELEILGITTVQGNVPVERGYSNATSVSYTHLTLPTILRV